MEMIEGIAFGESDLIWMGWREFSIQENAKLADLPELVKEYSFKSENRRLKDESIYSVFHLKEEKYKNIFSLFSMVEDSDLNEIYHNFKDKNPDYFIAFKLNNDD